MADKSSQLVIEALMRAAESATGVPLHGTRGVPGLFPTTTLGKQAAQRCRDEGYLAPARADSSSEGESAGTLAPSAARINSSTRSSDTSSFGRCVITPRGLTWLCRQTSPRQVLEDLLRALEARESQLAHLLDLTHQMQSSLAGLRTRVEQVLDLTTPGEPANRPLQALCRDFHSPAPTEDPADRILSAVSQLLQGWRANGSPNDCPLPWLYRQLVQGQPELTIGGFHDALRAAHEQGRIYLHPWTGPLPELPEPALALLSGHLVAYYASPQSEVRRENTPLTSDF